MYKVLNEAIHIRANDGIMNRQFESVDELLIFHENTDFVLLNMANFDEIFRLCEKLKYEFSQSQIEFVENFVSNLICL